MARKNGKLHTRVKKAIDSLSTAQKRNRDAVFRAQYDAIEAHFEELIAQLKVTIPIGTTGLGVTTTLGAPDGPTITPVILPPGAID